MVIFAFSIIMQSCIKYYMYLPFWKMVYLFILKREFRSMKWTSNYIKHVDEQDLVHRRSVLHCPLHTLFFVLCCASFPV